MKHVALTLAVLFLSSATASAQAPWAEKLFGGVTSHDFGGVPFGAQVKFSFPVKNIYAVPLTFMEVRSSCGCLTPTPNPRILKPQQTGSIDITIDTTRFTGFKKFDIFVTVGPEYISTAVLKVTITTRRDVVFNPGEINFGVVPQGQTPSKTVDVEYAGIIDWRMTEIVKNSTSPYEITAKEIYRQPPMKGFAGKVGYKITATLKKNAAPGVIKQELILKTNDPTTPVLTLLVEGNVQATLTVAPALANLGKVKIGEVKTLKVQVRGARPFRILGVDGTDGALKAEFPDTSAISHILVLRLESAKSGEIRRQLQIRTDLDDAVLTLPVEATIQK